MSKRGVCTDYDGDEIYPGDLVAYAARRGNTVRMADAIVLEVFTKRFQGLIIPFLKIQPTGSESGFFRRKSPRVESIALIHVRLIAHSVVKVDQTGEQS
jgi:hypothetical protein